MYRLCFFFILLLSSCGGNGSKGVLRVGVDQNWYPINFGPQTSYVNGYTEDLLIEMARYSGVEFERIPANWSSLLEGLQEGRYDAILTSMPPYIFNTAKYDFSGNFLDLGPVLILPVGAPKTDLSKMDNQLIGLIANDPAMVIVQQHPVILRNYSTVPDLLNAVVRGEIQGAVLDRIPAVNFVGDLYAGHLQIVGPPMTDRGLHLVAPKGKNRLVDYFNKNLTALRKKKTIDTLLKKWQLE